MSARAGSVLASAQRLLALALALLLVALGAIGALGALAACGETRLPIGAECLRSDDCLSGVCSSRACVAAPSLVNGAVDPPPGEMPLVPIVDGAATDASSDAPADAAAGGG